MTEKIKENEVPVNAVGVSMDVVTMIIGSLYLGKVLAERENEDLKKALLASAE